MNTVMILCVYIYITEIDHCDPYPCVNEGVCFNMADGYNCECMDGYEGTDCETGTIQIIVVHVYLLKYGCIYNTWICKSNR